jgi:ribosomal protein L17
LASGPNFEANLIHSPIFENARVKAMNEDQLTPDEENSLIRFRNIATPPVNGLDSSSFIEMLMSNKKRKVVKYDTEAMKLIPGTSNIVERLFCKVAHIYSSPEVDGCLHPQDVVFLNENTVNDLLAVKK